MITIEKLYSLFLQHPDISTDSRNVREGCLFFALKGDHFNGNEYAQAALERGAAHAFVDDPEYQTDDRIFLVEDTLILLQKLANYNRKMYKGPVLAITGTNGKTTTKELIHTILSVKFKTVATPGNLNNHIGVPLTLLGIRPETEFVIVEMGANHPGEIDFLCHIAEPTCGIITNIGRAHLEGFGGFEGVIKAKTELYRFLKSTRGIAFVNTDNSLLINHTDGINIIPYSSGPVLQPEAQKPPMGPYLKTRIKTEHEERIITTRLFGDYNRENIAAAACIGNYFSVGVEQITEAIESYKPQNNRSQIVNTQSNLLILDMYNANPSSMEPALENLARAAYQRKIVILGDMLELGNESDKEHRLILDLVDKLGFDEVFLVGPTFTRLNTKREFLCFQDHELASLWLDHHRITDATVLIKGSRGIKLEKLIHLL